MTSSGGEPKIYLRGVTPHTLIHGGLGHRHLLCEDLILLELYGLFAYPLVFMENTLK
jgi:hypothetical protein